MLTSIKNLIAMLVLVATFTSCDQNPSLQRYFVDHELKPGFTSVDIPTSVLNIEQTTLTEDQKEAYKSIDKLNMLAFIVSDDNRAEYEVELNKVKNILKDPKYQELLRAGNNSDGKVVVKFLGKEDSIDELIVFGNAKDKGFAVIRVLGDDMNAQKVGKLYAALNTANINEDQISQIADFFK